MAILPFVVFLGLGTMVESSSDPRLIGIYILSALVLSFVLSLGAFAIIQRANCGSVKNMKQISANAAIALAIQSVTLSLTWFFPGLRNIVGGLLPAETDVAIKDAIGYSYYSFWAGLFGTAIGGTLSGVC